MPCPICGRMRPGEAPRAGPVPSSKLKGEALETLDAALLAADARTPGAESLNTIRKRTGLRKEALIAHRDGCVKGGADQSGPAPDRVAAGSAQEASILDGSRSSLATGPPGGPSSTLTRATTPSTDPDRRTADLIRRIADVVAAGDWRGWATAVGLAQQLRIPIEEVLRLHQLAAGKVGEARGTQRAQRESAVAATRRMRDEEQDAASRFDVEARESYDAAKVETDPARRNKLYLHARQSRRLAGSHMRAALDAQKHLDNLTVLKPPAITVNVSYQSSPDFQLAFKALGEAADALFGPGSSRHLEQALGVLEDDGPEGFASWLQEHRVVVVTAERSTET